MLFQSNPNTLIRKLAQIEAQIEVLRNRVPDTNTAVTLLEFQNQQVQNSNSTPPTYSHQFQQIRENDLASPVSMGVGSHPSRTQAEVTFSQPFIESPRASYGVSSLKKKRGDFEFNVERSVDVVSKGLVSLEDAGVYFRAFFKGCVSYSLSV
jgi:hypothetical protein